MELPADEVSRSGPEWQQIADLEEFKALIKAKVAFILPATIFFVVYYFALLILVGWAPALMERKLFGQVNVAYLFALSQFFMAWIIAALYVRAANRFDRAAASVIAKIQSPRTKS